jgi:hypothetical protein
MLRNALRVLVLLALVPAAVAQTSEEPQSVDPASWVPADALVYVGVTDVGRTWEDFQKTATYKMFQETAAGSDKAELGVVNAVLEKLQEQLAKLLDVPQSQLKNPLTGPLALYLNVPTGGKLNKPEVTLIARVGDSELMKKYYESATAKLKKTAKHDTERAGSNTIDVFTMEPNAQKKAKAQDGDPSGAPQGEEDEEQEEDEEDLGLAESPEKMAAQFVDKVFAGENLPEKLAMCLSDDRLVVSGSADGVKAILKKDNGKSLADSEDHKAFVRQLKPLGTIHVLVNIPRLIEIAKAETSSQDAEELKETLKELGTESMRSVVGHLRFGASQYDSRAELLLLMNGERAGLAKLLSLENRPIAPPSSIAADTPLYAGVNIEVPKLLDDIERMMRASDAEAADSFRKSLEAMPLPGAPEPVNGRREFLDHLTGPLTFAVTLAKPIGPNCARLLLSLGHKDQTALVRFFSQMQGMLQPRDVRGTQVFDVLLAQGISIAAASDKLYVGSTPGIESALQNDKSDALAETSLWRRAAKSLPEQAWFVFYMDQQKLITTALELAKNKDAAPQAPGMDFGGMLISSLSGVGENAKAEHLAQLRKLAKYAAQSVLTIETTSEGLKMTQVTLKPEQE